MLHLPVLGWLLILVTPRHWANTRKTQKHENRAVQKLFLVLDAKDFRVTVTLACNRVSAPSNTHHRHHHHYYYQWCHGYTTVTITTATTAGNPVLLSFNTNHLTPLPLAPTITIRHHQPTKPLSSSSFFQRISNICFELNFLVACTRLYKSLCRLVVLSVPLCFFLYF